MGLIYASLHRVWIIAIFSILLLINGCDDPNRPPLDLDASSPLYGYWTEQEVVPDSHDNPLTVITHTLTFNRDGTYTIHVYHNPDAYGFNRPDDRTYGGTYQYENGSLSVQLDDKTFIGDLSQLPEYLLVDWGGEGGQSYYEHSGP